MAEPGAGHGAGWREHLSCPRGAHSLVCLGPTRLKLLEDRDRPTLLGAAAPRPGPGQGGPGRPRARCSAGAGGCGPVPVCAQGRWSRSPAPETPQSECVELSGVLFMCTLKYKGNVPTL